MDPFRLLARQHLGGHSMIGVGYGLFRQPADVPMLKQQVKGTGEAEGEGLQKNFLGLPLWLWLVAGAAALYGFSKTSNA